MRKNPLNLLITYFLRGLLLVIPFCITIYIISICLIWLDSLIKLKIPGLGMIIILVIITFLGYIGSTLLIKSLFDLIEKIITKLPIIRIIYSSLKEIISAFVGDRKKFSKPVLITLSKNIQKVGFITQENLKNINFKNKVAVYLPHSYNLSGNLLIINTNNIKKLNISSAEAMKFIISGGVTKINF